MSQRPSGPARSVLHAPDCEEAPQGAPLPDVDRALNAAEHPGTRLFSLAFGALQLPFGDVRPRPYSERRAALLNLLTELPTNTPIQAVSATTDRDTALTWYNALHNRGCLRTTAVSHQGYGG